MPSSAEVHRTRIGNFHPVFILILMRKSRLGRRQQDSDSYSPFVYWDFYTDLSYRLLVTTFCGIIFLLGVKCVTVVIQEGTEWQSFFDWCDSNIQQYLSDGEECLKSDRFAHWQRTVTMDGNTTNVFRSDADCCFQRYLNPSYGQFLILCGDIELNPGPNKTEELIKELGRSINARMDSLSSEVQSLSSALTTLFTRIETMTEQLKKREEDIVQVKGDIEDLRSDLGKIQRDVEIQRIESKRDNIVFYGIPELGEEKETKEDSIGNLIKILNKHDTSKTWSHEDITRAHRLGERKEYQERPRPVLIIMKQGATKRTLISSKAVRQNLRTEGIRMDDDLTVQQRQTLKDLRTSGFTAFWRGTRLYKNKRTQQSGHSTTAYKQSAGADASSNNGLRVTSMEEFPCLPPPQRSTQDDRREGEQTTGTGGTIDTPVSTPRSSPGVLGRIEPRSSPRSRGFGRGGGRQPSSSSSCTSQCYSNADRGSRGNTTDCTEDAVTEPLTRIQTRTRKQSGTDSNRHRGPANREVRHQRCIDDMMRDQSSPA